MNKQFATRRLADIMIDLYVLACVISRVSLALEENGVAKSSQELEILEIFANDAKRRIQQNLDQIDHNSDELINKNVWTSRACDELVINNDSICTNR